MKKNLSLILSLLLVLTLCLGDVYKRQALDA